MIREQELKAENDEIDKERITDNATKETQLQTHVENKQSIKIRRAENKPIRKS